MSVARGFTGHDAALAMDRMYRWQRGIYDVTRKPYLLGRDRVIDLLAPPPGGSVLEIGCGTGRNLIRAARAWPQARLHGYDVSSVMLAEAEKATARAGLCDRIALARGDALAFDARDAFRVAHFDRIYFSYVLSMIPQWREALWEASGLLAPRGRLLVVDFGDMTDLPGPVRAGLRRWLSLFHVTPCPGLPDELARIARHREFSVEMSHPYRRYSTLASIARPL